MPDPKEQHMLWFEAVTDDPQHWLGIFRKAFNSQSRCMHSGPTVVVVSSASHVEHVCTLCKNSFPTKPSSHHITSKNMTMLIRFDSAYTALVVFVVISSSIRSFVCSSTCHILVIGTSVLRFIQMLFRLWMSAST